MLELQVSATPKHRFADVFIITLEMQDDGTVESTETFTLQEGRDEDDNSIVALVVEALISLDKIESDTTGHPVIPRILAEELGSRFVRQAPFGSHFCTPVLSSIVYISDEGIEYDVTWSTK